MRMCARWLRQAQAFELAGAGQEALFRDLRRRGAVRSRGRSAGRSAAKQVRQRFARGDAQLQFDEIEPEHHLGHRMLDLQARVDLHEIEIAALADDELDRAGIDVVERARRRDRGFAHLRAQFRRDERRGRFLEHLLVAPLRRAFALVEMHDVAVAVAEHLELDVARLSRCSVRAARDRGRMHSSPRAGSFRGSARIRRPRARCACLCRRRRTRP